jgi:hypothetical protein
MTALDAAGNVPRRARVEEREFSESRWLREFEEYHVPLVSLPWLRTVIMHQSVRTPSEKREGYQLCCCGRLRIFGAPRRKSFAGLL